MHLLESELPVERLVVMIQKEVALRLVALPGTKEYGALTVAVQHRGRGPARRRSAADGLCAGARRLFRDRPPHAEETGGRSGPVFPALVKAAFGQRRKTLRNALRGLKLSAAEIEEALRRAGVEGDRRGETLSVAEFARLSKAVDGRCV